jgi:hypothetical protein
MKYLINMSGHPLSDIAKKTAKNNFDSIIDIPVPNVELSSTNINKFVDDNMELMKKNKTLSKAIMTLDYAVILPGMTPIATAILSALHGASGNFPKIAFLKKNSEGIFDFGEIIDIQEIRLKFRDFFRN